MNICWRVRVTRTERLSARDAITASGSQMNLWWVDSTHASKYGSYLSALTLFGTLTGLNPAMFGADEFAAHSCQVKDMASGQSTAVSLADGTATLVASCVAPVPTTMLPWARVRLSTQLAPSGTKMLTRPADRNANSGSVSGVAMAMAKVAKDTGTLLIVPNGGANIITGAMCAPNIFRSSFSNSQPAYAIGEVAAKKGHKKAVTITWKYAAGDEAFEGFKESYTKAGGTIIKELGLPFPNVEFQALLTEIAALKPDAVACFFAGGGAAKFLRDYAAAGLKGKIPLYGSGFLTEGVLDAAGPAADGVLTALHYGDGIETKRNKEFRLNYAKTFKMQPDVYAVQGYDTGLLLVQGANAVKGDVSQKAAMIKAMEVAVIDSPRGKWTMSKSHNPVQDIYLREVSNKENKVIGVAAKALADSGAGCRM